MFGLELYTLQSYFHLLRALIRYYSMTLSRAVVIVNVTAVPLCRMKRKWKENRLC